MENDTCRGAADGSLELAFTSYAGMDIGRDNGLVVDLDCEDKPPHSRAL